MRSTPPGSVTDTSDTAASGGGIAVACVRIKTPPELFVFVLLFFGLAALAAAQFGTGEISGLLVDQQGAAVANAEVIVTNQATAVSKVVATDAQGRYTALDLPVGRYSIEVRRPGFKTHTRS